MMNLKHPYEKHLAEKLVQLPPPGDPDQNWQQMKGLLDKDMPRGGGGPGGYYRWWIAGTVIVAVLVGTWFGGKQLITKDQPVAGTIKTVNNKKAPAVASTDKNVGQSATKNKDLSGAAYASTTRSAKDAEVTNDQQPDIAITNNEGNNAPDPTDKAAKARSSGNNNTTRSVTANNNNRASTDLPTKLSYHSKTSPDRKNIYAADSKNDFKRTGNNPATINNSNRGANNKSGYKPKGGNNAVVTGSAANKGNNKKGNNAVSKSLDRSNKARSQKALVEQSPQTYTPTIMSPLRLVPSGLKESPVTYKINYTGHTVISPSGMVQREFTYYMFPDKATASNKPARRKSSPFKTNEDKTFAVGLSLPLGFPIGDQQPLAYNSRGGVNTVSDYIPSPHFQYHFNRKTYVQAGVQFKAPQFIHPLLLYQNQSTYAQGSYVIEESTFITARKLYYFNLPFTIYHSPLKNFYMGTGLQFSSLLSGVAQHEEIRKEYRQGAPPQEKYDTYMAPFKDDMISKRLNQNEVRLLVDMSYYWSRFTVGLQYSQAFNNYVSIQVAPTSPYSFDKNKSLQFYLRYNIWEDKKRKQPKGASLLTLK
ncbi:MULTISPECIES: porin family protein [Niastella]|uniref:Outer membrane protein beta-barrel domain-containing protein n=1 Tax=Niastella soli TaxID=2821487 RepID=A0ABS3YQ65_9BACT|nr:hypothetical protein [Niastella soli]MBO9200031.1 hypothetical protein [Niastella soli]